MDGTIDMRMLLSGASFVFTTYFWFVKARKERPNLQFYQLSNFRSVCRRHVDGGQFSVDDQFQPGPRHLPTHD